MGVTRKDVIDVFKELAFLDDSIRRNHTMPYKHDEEFKPWTLEICGVKFVPAFPAVKNVIFNPPATVVLWSDGTKTVVKCGKRDAYDPEKGLAMAIAKKALGNKGSYFETFKKWVRHEEGGCGPDYCEIGD